jgi:adenylylsulfate kinase
MTRMKEERKAENITWHDGTITIEDRARRNGHYPAVLWFTGLSGSGKSTLARAVEEALFARGCQVYVLDGDNVRHGLNSNLGFSDADRAENIRRIGEVAKLFADAGMIVLTAFISPCRADRDRARRVIGDAFLEIHAACDLAVCEERDPKGLYARARRGEIAEFTGISAPYEAPEKPELSVNTGHRSLDECVEEITGLLASRNIFLDR